jgi:hypothetical protein
MVSDIHAEVLGWVLDEIGKQALGEDYGVAVQLGGVQVMTPQGPGMVPAWQLLITGRNPLLGEGPLFHGPVPVGGPRPVEAEVRAAATEGLRQLRVLAASKLAGSNGKAPARLARG